MQPTAIINDRRPFTCCACLGTAQSGTEIDTAKWNRDRYCKARLLVAGCGMLVFFSHAIMTFKIMSSCNPKPSSTSSCQCDAV